MSDDAVPDPQLDEFLEIRKPGAHLQEDVVADDFVLALGVDLTNFPKFPRLDDNVTYARAELDIRHELDVDSGAELPDYSGPYRADLRYTDFSADALAHKFIPWSERYMQLCVDGWSAEVAKRYGAEIMAEIEWTAWNDQVAPELERMKAEFLPADTVYTDPNSRVPEEERSRTGVVYTGLFSARPEAAGLPKEQLVTWLLGTHEYLLAVHRSLGDADHRSLRSRRDVRHPVDLVGRLGAARGEEAQGRLSRNYGQHGRGLDEGSAGRRDGDAG